MLLPLPIGYNKVAMFRVDQLTGMQVHENRRMLVKFPLFIERVDDAALMVMPSCRDRPMIFHACVWTSARLLHLIHSQPQVYDDDVDFTIDPRQLIQSGAALYEVDPNEMMNQYSFARAYLSHKELQHPLTIEAGLTVLQGRAKASTTIRSFH